MWWDDYKKVWWDYDEGFDCAYPYSCDCPACESVAERLLVEEEDRENELAERQDRFYLERLAQQEKKLVEQERLAEEERLATEKYALRKDVNKFGGLAQHLAERMKSIGEPTKGAPFPTGEISKLDDDEQRWPYITDNEEQRTLRCMRMVCEVNEWNRKIWCLTRTAGEAWEWHISLPLIFIMEFLVTRYAQMNGWKMSTKKGKIVKPSKFESATNICFANSVYDEQLCTLLHEARDWRNETHLSKRSRVGHKHDGSFRRYAKTEETLARLEEALEKHWHKSHM